MSNLSLGIGVIGLGVMGKTHIRAYQAAAAAGLACELRAVATHHPDELTSSGATGNLAAMRTHETAIDPAKFRITTDPADIARDPAIHAVSICTPTDTHADLAIMMLRAGKHVLVEKPVALTVAEVQRIAQAAQEANRTCMPAMCMRFWPGWDWLDDPVGNDSFGKVLSARFTRLGSRPPWSPEFYRDPARCGGAMFDLHIHDADFILWLFRRRFGMPRSVRSFGTIDHITTVYDFGPDRGGGNGPRHVVAEGGWLSQSNFPFRMAYTIEFEHCIADWDLSRPDPLILVKDGKASPSTLAQGRGTAYEEEVAHFLRIITEREHPEVTMDDAIAVTALLAAEKESLETAREVAVRLP